MSNGMNTISSIDWFFTQRLPGMLVDSVTSLAKNLPSGEAVSPATIQAVLQTTANFGGKDLKNATQIQQTNSFAYGWEYVQTAFFLAMRQLHMTLRVRTNPDNNEEQLAQLVHRVATNTLLTEKDEPDSKQTELATIKAKAKESITKKMPHTAKGPLTKGEMYGYFVRKGVEGTLAWMVRLAPLYYIYQSGSIPVRPVAFTAFSAACVYAWSACLVSRARNELERSSQHSYAVQLSEQEQKEIVQEAKRLFQIRNDDDKRLVDFRTGLAALELKTTVTTSFRHVAFAGTEQGESKKTDGADTTSAAAVSAAASAAAVSAAASAAETLTPEQLEQQWRKAVAQRDKIKPNTLEWNKANVRAQDLALQYYACEPNPDEELKVAIADADCERILSRIAIMRSEKPSELDAYLTRKLQELEDRLINEDVKTIRAKLSRFIRQLEELQRHVSASSSSSAAADDDDDAGAVSPSKTGVRPLRREPPPSQGGTRQRRTGSSSLSSGGSSSSSSGGSSSSSSGGSSSSSSSSSNASRTATKRKTPKKNPQPAAAPSAAAAAKPAAQPQAPKLDKVLTLDSDEEQEDDSDHE